MRPDVFHFVFLFLIFLKDDVEALRNKVLQSWLDPDVKYDPEKHGLFQYIHAVYERL